MTTETPTPKRDPWITQLFSLLMNSLLLATLLIVIAWSLWKADQLPLVIP